LPPPGCGETTQSSKSYREFMALWKKADANLSPLREAQKEYAESIKKLSNRLMKP
jgi:hypothetical protein